MQTYSKLGVGYPPPKSPEVRMMKLQQFAKNYSKEVKNIDCEGEKPPPCVDCCTTKIEFCARTSNECKVFKSWVSKGSRY